MIVSFSVPSQHSAESSNNNNTNQTSMSGDFGFDEAVLYKNIQIWAQDTLSMTVLQLCPVYKFSQMRQASECRVLC